MTERANCYVYVLFQWDGIPFYVGKGTGKRWLDHERLARQGARGHLYAIIRKMQARSVDIPKIKLHTGVTSTVALSYERMLISAIGRRHIGGPLVNLTDGGDGMSGYVPPPEVRARVAAGVKAALGANPEILVRRTATLKATLADPVARARTSARVTTQWTNPDIRNRIVAGLNAGWANPDRRMRSSEIAKVRMADPEIQYRLSERVKAAWVNADARARHIAALKAAFSKPESRVRRSRSAKAASSDPKVRAKSAELRTAEWNDPTIRNRRIIGLKAGWDNSDRRKESGAASKARWADPEYCKRVSAAIRAALRAKAKAA